VAVSHQGVEHQFDFKFRDPWHWITTLVTDRSLAAVSSYNSVKKYYCKGSHVEQLWDEPKTDNTWCDIDVIIDLSHFCQYLDLS